MATALEYGLGAAGLSLAIIAIVNYTESPQPSFQPASKEATKSQAWETNCSAYAYLKESANPRDREVYEVLKRSEAGFGAGLRACMY